MSRKIKGGDLEVATVNHLQKLKKPRQKTAGRIFFYAVIGKFGVAEIQAFFRAGDGDIEEAPFFVDIGICAIGGQAAFVTADDEYVLPLAALRRVNRHQLDKVVSRCCHFLGFSQLFPRGLYVIEKLGSCRELLQFRDYDFDDESQGLAEEAVKSVLYKMANGSCVASSAT